jgi:hypothetical protein
MVKYQVVVEPTAIKDIQQAIDYYDEQQIGLGEKFEESLNAHFVSLETNPFFQIRYKTFIVFLSGNTPS